MAEDDLTNRNITGDNSYKETAWIRNDQKTKTLIRDHVRTQAWKRSNEDLAQGGNSYWKAVSNTPIDTL